jgi:hypothetical protein
MKETDHLIAGLGQIGYVIRDILDGDSVDILLEKTTCKEKKYHFLHICFPYEEGFIDLVKRYQERFSPNVTVIHSTVPVGTSESLSATHSPCRGVHPNLKEGIMTFVKYFGGEGADEAAKAFFERGIKVIVARSSNDTEAMKLWDTTIYGWNIVLEKTIFAYCKKHNLDFDLVYTEANRTYNEGYSKLGRPEFQKYILKHVEGKIGGHCVVNNLNFLESDISDIIKRLNI